MPELLNKAQEKRMAQILDSCGVCRQKAEFINAIAPDKANDLIQRIDHAQQFATRAIELNAASKEGKA